METRYAVSPQEYAGMDTAALRSHFLIEKVFEKGKLRLCYSHFDRIIAGGAVPGVKGLSLTAGDELRAAYFLERREMGVINIGGKGVIRADGTEYQMGHYDCLYLGRGVKEVVFFSEKAGDPAEFYINSTPAHCSYPTAWIPLEKAVHLHLGSKEDCNERTINKFIIPDTVRTSQLTMGLTQLDAGSVWNTMPCHTHERRMEVYLYFDMTENDVVFHMMGGQNETRHLVVQNKQAVISPSWSIHSGVGTRNYTFIWGMCGENQDFDDMQNIKTTDLR